MAQEGFKTSGKFRNRIDQLARQAYLSAWPTPPSKENFRSRSGDRQGEISMDQIAPDGPARLTASGEMLTGSNAGMESGGLLDPAHSAWLQGLPAGWDELLRTVTR